MYRQTSAVREFGETIMETIYGKERLLEDDNGRWRKRIKLLPFSIARTQLPQDVDERVGDRIFY